MEKALLIIQIISYSLSIPFALYCFVGFRKLLSRRRRQQTHDEWDREHLEHRCDQLVREKLILAAKIEGRDIAAELAKDTIATYDELNAGR